MSEHKSPRPVHHRSRRLSVGAIVWRPFNLLLMLAFLLGIGLAGWQQYGYQPSPDAVSPVRIALVPSQAVAVRPVSRPAADVMASVPAVQAGSAHGLSGAPTSLPPSQPRLQPYEEAQGLTVMAAPAAAPVVPLPPGHRPRIAIVIDDLGPDWQGSVAATRLPAPVTLALLPYASRLPDLVARAKAGGHELILHMPMEPEDLAHNDPGPIVLLTTDGEQALRSKLAAAFATYDGFVGINNHMGSRFTADLPGMHVVLSDTARRNLFFLDSRTSGRSVAQAQAARSGVRFVGRDVFLDNELDAAAVRTQLELTEQIARRRGQAVAIGHPHAVTLQVLQVWIPQARRAGFELVPVRVLARKEPVNKQISNMLP